VTPYTHRAWRWHNNLQATRPEALLLSVSVSRWLDFLLGEGHVEKRCPLGARCWWPASCSRPRRKASGVSCRADVQRGLLSERDKPRCEHKALNISVVGMWRLYQNPELLIASFESRICLNNTIKLCFKPAFSSEEDTNILMSTNHTINWKNHEEDSLERSLRSGLWIFHTRFCRSVQHSANSYPVWQSRHFHKVFIAAEQNNRVSGAPNSQTLFRK